ncbi:hypothetical protein N7517_004524 [Penicillium concentricum]|uniref:Peptidase S8/S53 domain-containing protein n=1 Tax=Penicillium concentricum TaxID=293559 RepID=A0A9W9V890_9EURO|nr:uncharacterized protein N7517_004524 [Penicillium concentricum]KAJ5372518.1 hypothetical protein N7517_004524 [Penicillium concentricum]
MTEKTEVTEVQDTLLHFLAESPKKDKWFSFLVGNIINVRPNLVGHLNRRKQSSLYVAIKQQNKQYLEGLRVVAKNFVKRPDLQQAIRESLQSECVRGGADTFLHEAMSSQSVPLSDKKLLISITPLDGFCSIDSNGLTPIHHAVAYENCFIDQDQEEPSKGWRQCQRENASSRSYPSDERPPERDTETNRATKGLPKRPSKEVTLEVAIPERPSVQYQANITERRTTTAIPGGLLKRSSTLHPDEMENVVDGAENPKEDTEWDEIAERDQVADRVRDHLKLWYLRRKTPKEVVRHLKGRGTKHNTFWFDYGPSPAKGYTLTSKEFRKNFIDIALEPILKYVAFPEMSINLNMSEDEALRDKRNVIGRNDMVFFFNWLRERKVKQVLNVCVEDLNNPHPDEAIEEALEGFKVEGLDWKKMDLCPDCIVRVGGSIQTLHLQWSGNNVALRAWSAPEGLAKLPALKNLIIHRRKKTDSPEREQYNENAFECHFQTSWNSRNLEGNGKDPTKKTMPKIKWQPNYIPNTTGATGEDLAGSTGQGIHDTDAWIKSLEMFRSRFPRPRDLPSSLSGKGLEGPIVVGLIDDGVNTGHPDLTTYKFTGTSFHEYDDDQKIRPFWDSTAGHGTVMARMIHRIAPNVRLHVCRLQTHFSENETDVKIDPQSAVDAIHDCINSGVHVISISWTIPPPESQSLRKEFSDAITEAIQRDILVFCSVSDQGKRADDTYPLNCGSSGIFRIGAAKASGEIWGNVGEPDKLDFAFPGYEVMTKDPAISGAIEKFTAHTGSSVATAIASGFAALIMEWIRVGCVYELENSEDPRLDISDWEKIHQRDGMAAAFRSIRAKTRSDGKFIAVEKVFMDYAKELEGQDRDGKARHLSKLAQQLL